MNLALKTVKIEDNEASSNCFKPYVNFKKKYQRVVFPEKLPKSEEEIIQTLNNTLANSTIEAHIFGLYLQDNPSEYIGIFHCGIFKKSSPNYESDKHISLADIKVLPSFRQQGVAKHALREIAAHLSNYSEVKYILGKTIESYGRSVISHIGGIEAHIEVENRLYLDQIDWSLTDSWIAEGYANNFNTKIHAFEYVPADILESYAKTYQAIANQVPRGDMQVVTLNFTPEQIRASETKIKHLGKRKLALATVEANGDVSGISELFYNPKNTTCITQGISGILEAYRGHGLGKLLKACGLMSIKKNFPQITYIKTNNAPTNEPIIHINKKLGFTTWQEQVDFQLSTKDLLTYLEAP